MSVLITDTTSPAGLQLGGYIYSNTVPASVTPNQLKKALSSEGDFAPRINMADMNSDVFNAKIDTLIDLWVTRYGNAWVDLDGVMDDEFYGRVYKRLKAMSQLEVHFLTDRAKFVCRKPE